MSEAPLFDSFADTYDAELNQALSPTGETKDYFAKERVKWLTHCLALRTMAADSILDFGCGTGDTTSLLRSAFHARRTVGLDVSERSLLLARQRNGENGCEFYNFSQHSPDGSFDLAYCNGVFHHIPVRERNAAVEYVYRYLRPGGLFAFWENNPWNPGTRFVMSRIAFDRNAETLAPPEARKLLLNHGFKIARVDYRFFFPGFLKLLRFAEPWLRVVPLGAQYQILAKKPL
jgi:SAM-dependent methyltransferase